MKTLFLGDVCATIKTEPLFAADQTAPLFDDIFPIFAGNDINMVNLECALTERTDAIKKIGEQGFTRIGKVTQTTKNK